MSSLIIDLQYFGSVGWYKKVYNYKHVYLSEYEKHAKMSFRNRTLLASADGVLRLSVPIVDGRNERQFYKAIKIVAGRWPKEHFRAIVSCYNRSPWFEHYRDELAALFEREYEYLFDWNLACHDWVAAKLKLPTNFIRCNSAEEYAAVCTGADENWVNRIRPRKEENAGDGAMTNSGGTNSGEVNPSGANPGGTNPGEDGPRQLGTVRPYRQVFQEKTGFIAGLSILDLLFCEGPLAANFLST